MQTPDWFQMLVEIQHQFWDSWISEGLQQRLWMDIVSNKDQDQRDRRKVLFAKR